MPFKRCTLRSYQYTHTRGPRLAKTENMRVSHPAHAPQQHLRRTNHYARAVAPRRERARACAPWKRQTQYGLRTTHISLLSRCPPWFTRIISAPSDVAAVYIYGNSITTPYRARSRLSVSISRGDRVAQKFHLYWRARNLFLVQHAGPEGIFARMDVGVVR